MKLDTIGVVGAGTMGVGVSSDLILHGLSVVLIDNNDKALERAEAKILESVRFAPVSKPTLCKLEEDEIPNRIKFSTDLDAAKGCHYIIENVTEDWDIKKPVYEQLSALCDEDVCFGVNTSCTSITKVGAATDRPKKVIGLHFMNPAYLIDGIEVMRGFHTSDDTMETTLSLLKRLGKRTTVVGDLPGFVSNRVSHVFMNEAAFVVQDQLAEPSQVDEIFRNCFGHSMGPLETADLIGLDTVVNSLRVLFESFQDSKFRCCPLLQKMVQAGQLGRKTGSGFYTYGRSGRKIAK
jgi:3-hydroxybutyryl-CoA dehydrogenase